MLAPVQSIPSSFRLLGCLSSPGPDRYRHLGLQRLITQKRNSRKRILILYPYWRGRLKQHQIVNPGQPNAPADPGPLPPCRPPCTFAPHRSGHTFRPRHPPQRLAQSGKLGSPLRFWPPCCRRLARFRFRRCRLLGRASPLRPIRPGPEPRPTQCQSGPHE